MACYIISYDIANPKRLAKVHKYVSKIALRLQLSVYYIECSQSELNFIIDGLEERIHPKEDDIRFYPTPKKERFQWFGKSPTKEALWLVN
ncbi:MAG: CRISPR-associated endonuclease Cas2 [Venatoribacter sp.]